ncbi:MAG: DUF1553 domain-containing protein [Lentisphaeria bacterium]|nr:DUF1553 domain-containing protein [Lentisphaeria bacterium]
MHILRLFTIFSLLPLFQLAASPYNASVYFDNTTGGDKILFDHWNKKQVRFPTVCSDAVFLRRVALTAAGRLPTASEVRSFLANNAPDKRAALVEKFLNDPAYADMQAMRFADMLRIKAEFPINLWPNAVQLWHRTLWQELRDDRPLNAMFRDMLTLSGSNFRVPHANFFRASADRSPKGLAGMVLLTAMGMETDALNTEQMAGMIAFFSCIRYKSTYEWKEEIVYNDYNCAILNAMFPDGKRITLHTPADDPRKVFADWLLDEKNPYFARAVTNRVWHWCFGRGIFPDADNLPLELNGRKGNEPFSQAYQQYLIREFCKGGYSLKNLYRVIMNSAAFQASSVSPAPGQTENFAAYPIHRMEAELVIDALAGVTRQFDRYTSVIPEPFTFLPAQTRAVTIADGSISTGVLDNFGRPPRDSGNLQERNTASTDSQLLYLKNSASLFQRTRNYTRRIQREGRTDNARLDRLYLDILSRYPTLRERQAFENYRKQLAPKERWMIWEDTAWVLFNSKEFLFHH